MKRKEGKKRKKKCKSAQGQRRESENAWAGKRVGTSETEKRSE